MSKALQDDDTSGLLVEENSKQGEEQVQRTCLRQEMWMACWSGVSKASGVRDRMCADLETHWKDFPFYPDMFEQTLQSLLEFS